MKAIRRFSLPVLLDVTPPLDFSAGKPTSLHFDVVGRNLSPARTVVIAGSGDKSLQTTQVNADSHHVRFTVMLKTVKDKKLETGDVTVKLLDGDGKEIAGASKVVPFKAQPVP